MHLGGIGTSWFPSSNHRRAFRLTLCVLLRDQQMPDAGRLGIATANPERHHGSNKIIFRMSSSVQRTGRGKFVRTPATRIGTDTKAGFTT